MKNMKWSGQQDKALKDVQAWLKTARRSREMQPVFRLFGYAGTGKTTLARHMADMVRGEVKFASLSGKAASVLRSKGCEGAQTIHSLIYRPIEDGSGKIKWELRNRDSEKPSELYHASLLILDEVSMVGDDLAKDLLSFEVPILAIGDPAQLPPVEGSGYFTHPDIKPDMMLDEIHRQAKGNPIIDMATRVRNGDMLSHGDYGEGNTVIPRRDYDAIMLGANQVLCATNAKRQKFNAMIRNNFGVADHIPLKNDKLICLNNDRENRALLNGTVWYVDEMLQQTKDQKHGGLLPMLVWNEDDPDLRARIECFDDMFGIKTNKQMSDFKTKASQGFHNFDYGYVMTVHKAQGSQWDNVVIYDDYWGDDSYLKWLYTALTRAAEKVTLIGVR